MEIQQPAKHHAQIRYIHTRTHARTHTRTQTLTQLQISFSSRFSTHHHITACSTRLKSINMSLKPEIKVVDKRECVCVCEQKISPWKELIDSTGLSGFSSHSLSHNSMRVLCVCDVLCQCTHFGVCSCWKIWWRQDVECIWVLVWSAFTVRWPSVSAP